MTAAFHPQIKASEQQKPVGPCQQKMIESYALFHETAITEKGEKTKLLLFLSVQVGRLQFPLLLVAGEDDQNWPAQESALDVSFTDMTSYVNKVVEVDEIKKSWLGL